LHRNINNQYSYLGHGIDTVFRFHLGHANNISAVRGEFPAEEKIDEINLTDDVDKVENFADKESDSVEIVVMQVGGKVVDQELFPFVFRFFSDDGAVEV
jgi:hypothetical protein